MGSPRSLRNTIMESYIGMIALFPYDFAPRGWHACDGSILSINQNTALFTLLGTTFGGNGRTTFALPDLRGRSPIGVGESPSLGSTTELGEAKGANTVTLPTETIALVQPQKKAASADKPAVEELPPVPTEVTAVSGPVSIANPTLGLHWCICLQGIYPSRD